VGRRSVQIRPEHLILVSKLSVRQAVRELAIAQGTLIKARRAQCL